jgi:hypothetical protein
MIESIHFVFSDKVEVGKKPHAELYLNWSDESVSRKLLPKIDTEIKFRYLVEIWDAKFVKGGLIDIDDLEDNCARRGHAYEEANRIFREEQIACGNLNPQAEGGQDNA